MKETVAGYGGWFGAALIFVALRAAIDLWIAIETMTALNFLFFGLMTFVLISAFYNGLKPFFRVIGAVILIGRGMLNLALIIPYWEAVAQAGPVVLPNMVISLILPTAVGIYFAVSQRVRRTMAVGV